MRKVRLLVLAAAVVLTCIGLDQRMIVRRYTIETDKVDAPVRLAVVTDLHGNDYGPEGSHLTAPLEKEQPDAILLVGDMFSADGDATDELAFFHTLSDLAPTCYVPGNHEYWEYDLPALCADIRAAGVHVLDQNCLPLQINGQTVNICGIPDPVSGVDTGEALARAADAIHLKGYTVLLSHRPELFGQYAATGDFDLVLCGHAHGGQVRIPLLVNGLYAPDQGLFPKYAGGRYDESGTTMIVSRGLSKQQQWYIPRIFNRPELVLVTIQ